MQFTQQQLDLIAMSALAGLILGFLIAGIIGLRKLGALRTEAAILQTQLKNQEVISHERELALDLASQQLSTRFDQLASQTLKNNSDIFLRLAKENLGSFQTKAEAALSARQRAVEHLINPVAKALTETKEQIAKVERERHQAFGGINQQLKSMNQAQMTLQAETANLVSALKRPEVRGRWGEITLKRLVELAGMVEHCDFTEQTHVNTEDGSIRPDMIVKLPEDRTLVVDVKTPLDAYLAAVEAQDDHARKQALIKHTRHVRERIKELSAKGYWRQFKTSPDFIVLFLPGDQFLSAALQIDANLIDEALGQKIILATPSNLMALLKTVSYGWRQVSLAKNAEHISTFAETLYKRLAVFSEHLVKMGNSLGASVDAYNKAVGSLERNVLPGARKFTELGIRQAKEIPDINPIDKTARETESKETSSKSTSKNNTYQEKPTKS